MQTRAVHGPGGWPLSPRRSGPTGCQPDARRGGGGGGGTWGRILARGLLRSRSPVRQTRRSFPASLFSPPSPILSKGMSPPSVAPLGALIRPDRTQPTSPVQTVLVVLMRLQPGWELATNPRHKRDLQPSLMVTRHLTRRTSLCSRRSASSCVPGPPCPSLLPPRRQRGYRISQGTISKSLARGQSRLLLPRRTGGRIQSPPPLPRGPELARRGSRGRRKPGVLCRGPRPGRRPLRANL